TFWTREGLGVRYVAPALPFVFLVFGGVVQRAVKRTPALALLAVGLVAVPNVVGTLAWYGRPTLPPAFWDPTTLVATLDARTAPGDAVVFVSAEQAGYYQALSTHPRSWILIPAGTDYLQGNVVEKAAATLPDLSARSRVIWLVLYRGVLGDGTTKLGDWLSTHDFPVATQTVPDSEIDPYVGLATDGTTESLAQNVAYSDGVRLVDARIPVAISTNGVLPVQLRWQAAGPLDRNLKVFVHLVNPKGDVVSQHDSLPENGRAPFVQWPANQIFDDRHGLLLSSAVVPGDYWLEIGLYDEHGRLPLQNGGDTLRLGPMRVTGAGDRT
ncbi:MAG TPA: hypothetical protein VFZ25_07595, partial [Chloroflexota bacterium]|nr:hypothetical protein [Chloroflexota bacterium]